jgi:hypothetical protein
MYPSQAPKSLVSYKSKTWIHSNRCSLPAPPGNKAALKHNVAAVHTLGLCGSCVSRALAVGWLGRILAPFVRQVQVVDLQVARALSLAGRARLALVAARATEKKEMSIWCCLHYITGNRQWR